MQPPFPPRLRAERLIAVGRVVLAGSSLLALWRDPSEPAKYAATAYGLLAAYLAYSTLLALFSWRTGRSGGVGALVEHSFDLVFFSTFMYFTSGPASPFIAYFVFSLVCATLRWRWRGTLWTAVASLASFLGLGYYFSEVLRDPAFQLNEWVIRGVYMAVVALLLGYLGWHEERSRSEIALLAAWPDVTPGDSEPVLDDLLVHVARIHPGKSVALAWSLFDEPRTELVLHSDGASRRLAFERPLHALVGAGADDFLLASRPAGLEVALLRSGTPARWNGGSPLASELAAPLGGRSILSTTWTGRLVQLRLFVVDPRWATTDDLQLAGITAALAGARVEGIELLARIRSAAASEERVRLARDLHDGVLQSLTGFGLRLAAARRLLPGALPEAERSLEELQQLVALEQRDLRFVIQDLEPPRRDAPMFDLAPRLAELLQRAEQEWSLRVELEADTLDDDLPELAERDLYFLVREALVNAARHGGARRITVRLRRPDPDRLLLEVSDDGRGFPFHGRFDLAALTRAGTGPRSLRERVASRGGRLDLDTGPGGTRLEIELPLAAAVVR